MNRLAKEGLLGNLNKVELSTCEHCLARKNIKEALNFPTKENWKKVM